MFCFRIVVQSRWKKSRDTNLTAIMMTKIFPPYQSSTMQVNKQINLIYAQNVVNVTQEMTTWKDIRLPIREANRFLAITVIILVHGKISLTCTYEHTPVNVPNPVTNVILPLHRRLISPFTYGHTHRGQTFLLWCVR